MDNEFSTERTTTERVVIGALILLGTAILLGIQSLFLNHISSALPQDPLWRMVTIACFLAPPIAFAFLVMLKLNFSRSESQDYILIGGMSLELVLFVINLVVAVNAQEISGTMLGIIGILLGGAAGVISAATTAYALSADPLRGVAKARIQHGLKVEQKAQKKTEGLIDQAMDSERVLAKAEAWAENYVSERLGQTFARRVSDGSTPPAPAFVKQTPPERPASNGEAHDVTFHESVPGIPAKRNSLDDVIERYQFDENARSAAEGVFQAVTALRTRARREGILLDSTYDPRNDMIGDAARLESANDLLHRLRVELDRKQKEKIVGYVPKS